jgi:dolichyl-phosphate-mannose--protein O-mannosyl transferase
MARYHLGLDTVKANGEPIHPYMSRAWSWLLLTRPVAYYWQGDPSCCAEILGIGSPALFWGAFLVIPYLALSWVSRKEWQAGAILVPILAQLVPWLVVARPLFLFYMTPVTPFLALGMVYPLRDLVRSRLDKRLAVAAAATVIGTCVGLFAFFLPVLAAGHLTYDQWHTRIWFSGWI